nr:hypothetical protein [Mesobacterium pallidum]
MQLALAAGAPLGRYTLGGRFPGRLPPAFRALALVQAALLAAMALAVLARAGIGPVVLPGWTFRATLGLTALTTLANLATPSVPERRLWGPVTLAMLGAALVVALG